MVGADLVSAIHCMVEYARWRGIWDGDFGSLLFGANDRSDPRDAFATKNTSAGWALDSYWNRHTDFANRKSLRLGLHTLPDSRRFHGPIANS